MKPCHICGRQELKAFASEVCFGKEGDLHREQCIDGGIGRLGMNPNWQRLKAQYPWMADKGKKTSASSGKMKP